MNQSIQAHLRELAVFLVVFSIALLGSPAARAQTQQQTKISFQVPAEHAKYTQQHAIDVADMPGHAVGSSKYIAPFPRTFPRLPACV